MPTFDRTNLIMTLDAGLDVFDWEYYYDEWKQWSLAHSTNRKCPPAFNTAGGEDVITGQLNAGSYYFFRNDLGWRMRPAEEDATMYPTGNLIPQSSSLPIFVPTVGDFTVAILGLQPITQSVSPLLLTMTNIESQVNVSRKILQNKTQTDPVTGIMTVFDDDGITVLFTANIWENVAGTTPYQGDGVDRREALG